MSQAFRTSADGPPALATHPGDALPVGLRLGEFEIRAVLGSGGFGIVYRAWDRALEREVALKEYMPVTLASRGAGHRLVPRSASHADTFALGLRSFVNEARLLARFDHPSLVKVFHFWEDNATAYMAMPMYHGRTLRQARLAMPPGSPGGAFCRQMMEPLLGAIESLHREGVFHRDIAPDNIILTHEQRPVLLDFGAARRVIGDPTHALTAILKPHFAPIEQYADASVVRQGPWTDLYGLAATAYYLLTGQPPMPAAARALQDELPPLVEMRPSQCSPAFLAAIDWAMAVRPQDRPQNVAEWRTALEGRATPPPRPVSTNRWEQEMAASVAGTPAGATQEKASSNSSRPLKNAPGRSPHFRTDAGFATTLPLLSEGPEHGFPPFKDRRRGSSRSLPRMAGALALAVISLMLVWKTFGPGAGALTNGAIAAQAVAIDQPARAAEASARDVPGNVSKADRGIAGRRPTLDGPLAASSTPDPTLGAESLSAREVFVAPQARTLAAPGAAQSAGGGSENVALASQSPAPVPQKSGGGEAERADSRGRGTDMPRPRERQRERERDQADTRVAFHADGLQACEGRSYLARLICVQRACDRDAALRVNPECMRMRAQRAEEERRANQVPQ